MKEFFVESKPTPKTTFFKKNGELTKKEKGFKDLKQHEDKTVVFTEMVVVLMMENGWKKF